MYEKMLYLRKKNHDKVLRVYLNNSSYLKVSAFLKQVMYLQASNWNWRRKNLLDKLTPKFYRKF